MNYNDFQWHKYNMNWISKLNWYIKSLEEENRSLILAIRYIYENYELKEKYK